MSKKVVLVHYAHEFCGYRSDCDYDGNAIFGDDLIEAQYVSKRKAKELLVRAARSLGMYVCTGRLMAIGEPEDPHYSSERDYLEILDPADFLFTYGSLQGRLKELSEDLGNVSKRDMDKYLIQVTKLAEEYDPF